MNTLVKPAAKTGHTASKSSATTRPRVNQIPAPGQKTGYQFVDKDPDMDIMMAHINASRMTPEQIEAATIKIGRKVSRHCIVGWMFGGVKRPQNYTMTSVAMAIGIERQWQPKKVEA
jgi:hypothetical protein